MVDAARHPREYSDGKIVLDVEDNRLVGTKAPCFEQRENSTVWEELQPQLEALDLRHGVPDWAVIHDERWKPLNLEFRRIQENQVMAWTDEALDQIIGDGNDTYHRIDEDLRTQAKYLILLAQRRRSQYGMRLYNQRDVVMDTREIWWTDHLHWWHSRKGGDRKPYSRGHIMEACELMIIYTGLIGRKSRTGMLRHDDGEDLKKSPTPHHDPDIEKNLLVCNPYIEEYRALGKEKFESVLDELEELTIALTKIKGLAGGRMEEALMATRRVLEAIGQGGLITLALKGADRLHNLRDIKTNPSAEAQSEIVTLSALMYAPLQRKFKLNKLYDETLLACFRAANPQVIDRYERTQRERRKRYLGKPNEIPQELKTKLEKLKEHPDITYIALHPTPFCAYVDPTEINNPDYVPTVGSEDAMFEIMIAIRIPEDEKDRESCILRARDAVVQHLRAPLGKGREKTGYNKKEGGWVHVFNPDLFPELSEKTTLRVRINDERNEALSTRGLLTEEKENIAEIHSAITAVLAKTAKDVKGLLKALEEELLRPRISITTPRNDVRELPQGSSAIDFIFSVYPWLCLETRGVLVCNEDPRIPGKEFNPFDELTDGMQLRVVTTKEADQDIRVAQEHPFNLYWSYFTQSSYAREYLPRACIRQARHEAIAQNKGETTGVEEIKLQKLHTKGQQHLQEVSKLLGIANELDLVLAILETQGDTGNHRYAKRTIRRLVNKQNRTEPFNEKDATDMTRVIPIIENEYIKMGSGETDFLRSLLENFKLTPPVMLEVEALDIPGIESQVSKLLGIYRMNIEDEIGIAKMDAGRAKLTYQVIPQNDVTAFDLFKALVRIQQDHGYPVQVTSKQFQNIGKTRTEIPLTA